MTIVDKKNPDEESLFTIIDLLPANCLRSDQTKPIVFPWAEPTTWNLPTPLHFSPLIYPSRMFMYDL